MQRFSFLGLAEIDRIKELDMRLALMNNIMGIASLIAL